METRRTLLVDAFTTEPLAGNAAGVVPDASGLDEARMAAIANELGASETAFLTDSDEADRRIRYFTPTQEVDLCGHATIASHAHLHDEGIVDAGEQTLETNVGVLTIEITETGVIWMTQETPQVDDVDLSYDRLGRALGIDPASMQDVGQDLPIARATTGLPFLVVPVNFLEHLGGADPDTKAIEAISEEFDVAGIYAFTFDALEGDSTLHARMWAPAAGVPEDPVTGTASGACGAYLNRFDAFEEFPEEMRFEQGHFVDRGGHVRVRVDGDDVTVGGRAATALDGTVTVPDVAEDEIIEA